MVLHLVQSSSGDSSKQLLEVLLFVSLNGLEHGGSTSLHVMLSGDSLTSQEGREGILLHEVILFVDVDILHLLLGVHQVLLNVLFGHVGPNIQHLGNLIVGVGVVPVGELGTHEEGEVTSLNEGQVEAEEILVMEDHSTDPLVVRPPSHSGDGRDRSNVEEEEDEATSASGKGLVVRGNLLWSHSVVQEFHVFHVREDEWVGFCVVWMLVSFAHAINFSLIVGLAICCLVFGLDPTISQNEISKHSIC